MIAVIKMTGKDAYNIFGTRGDDFVLQGNLNKAELVELNKQIDAELKNSKVKASR